MASKITRARALTGVANVYYGARKPMLAELPSVADNRTAPFLVYVNGDATDYRSAGLVYGFRTWDNARDFALAVAAHHRVASCAL